MDINNIKRIALFRTLELTISSIVLSVVLVWLNVVGYVTSSKFMGLILMAGAMIFYVYNIMRMRLCYFAVRNKKLYYASNIIAYIIFAVISMIIYFVFGMGIYTWFFGIFRFLRYVIDGVGNPFAVIVFHLFGILSVFAATIGAGWIFEMPVPEEEGMENEEVH